MVIVKLSGGLANQMFPYATGRRLSHVLGTELKLDISDYIEYDSNPKYTPRQYGLGVFNIQEHFATPDEISALTEGSISLMRRVLGKKAKRPACYVRERGFAFNPEILKLSGDVYLSGNWNSEKYFADITDILKKEFTLKSAPTGKNAELIEEVKSKDSVSLHVRRGDYISNPKANAVHGTCGVEYYHHCIEKMATLVRNPHFYIFSDDPEWAIDNLRIPYPTKFVTHNKPEQGHEDFRLMSSCHHNIIANSGFSWWAAWLNPNINKIVIAPKQWFKTPKYDTSTLLPDGWLKI